MRGVRTVRNEDDYAIFNNILQFLNACTQIPMVQNFYNHMSLDASVSLIATVYFQSINDFLFHLTVCFQYPDDFPIDSFTRSARAFGVLAAIIGGICMIILWFSACIAMEVWQWRVVSGFILLSCFFEGLTFLMFNSNLCNTLCYEMVDIQSKCSLAWGARTAIAALVFWFVAGVSTWFMPVAQPIDPIVIRKKTVKTEKTSPDGTKTITTETFSTSV